MRDSLVFNLDSITGDTISIDTVKIKVILPREPLPEIDQPLTDSTLTVPGDSVLQSLDIPAVDGISPVEPAGSVPQEIIETVEEITEGVKDLTGVEENHDENKDLPPPEEAPGTPLPEENGPPKEPVPIKDS